MIISSTRSLQWHNSPTDLKGFEFSGPSATRSLNLAFFFQNQNLFFTSKIRKFFHCFYFLLTSSSESMADSYPKLQLRDLGNTGLKTSSVGFGASPLGSVFSPVSEEDAVAAVREAFRLGINFFDTSPYVNSFCFSENEGGYLR